MIMYDRSWVVKDGSSPENPKTDEDLSDDLDVIEGPGFHGVEDSEEEDDFWETNDRIVRKGYLA
jgi:hypothetical protein